MEIEDLAKRIAYDIAVVFKREPNLDEFDIIPILESQNKSPVTHIGTKLGLEAWCVKLLYSHVYNSVMQWKERIVKAEDLTVAHWTEVALMLNPEILTFWNIRKEFLSKEKITQADEIRLSKLVLTRKPKSPELFCHRRWLVKSVLKHQNSQNNEELVKNELMLCTIAASRYPNNYAAWCHRQWVHNNVTVNNLGIEVLFCDLKWSESWIEQHVSDHSGIQFRQYLLTTIAKHLCQDGVSSTVKGDVDTTIPHLLDAERQFVHRLILDFPGHETLWYHCRFVTYFLHTFGALDTDNATGPICKKTKMDIGGGKGTTESHLHKTFLPFVKPEEELSFADNAQSYLASRHKRWLTQRFGSP